MKKLPILLLFFLVFSYSFLLATPIAKAQCTCTCSISGLTVTNPQESETTCNAACKALNSTSGFTCVAIIQNTTPANGACPSGQVCLTDPLNLRGDPSNLWARLIGALLAFVGVGALVTFVYAGFMFLTSSGNPEQVKKAKDTMIYAVLGVAVSMGAYVILSYIFDILQKPLS